MRLGMWIQPAALLDDLLFLVYPRYCPACDRRFPIGSRLLCLTCTVELPLTGHHLYPENELTERFWGRLNLEGGAAMYNFVKEGRVQRLVHALKYRGRTDVGLYLGMEFGQLLRKSPSFPKVDCVVPVPLHPRKERTRGYNQSSYWARGLARSLGVPHFPRALKRRDFTRTQTHKTRMERMQNVQRAFQVRHAETLAGKHVLLVDDVLTTGATLESCGQLILDLPGSRLSLATLALAKW